jgi:hypothetical protein
MTVEELLPDAYRAAADRAVLERAIDAASQLFTAAA